MFTKAHCQPCKATKQKLDQLDIPYEVIELTPESASAFRDQGLATAPVVRVDLGEGAMWHWSGYAPSSLERLDHAFGCDEPDCTTCYAVIAA